MQVVPKTPLSRAMSHSFSQLPSLLDAIACTYCWEGWVEASVSSRDKSNWRISFFREWLEISSEDVSTTSVVRLEDRLEETTLRSNDE